MIYTKEFLANKAILCNNEEEVRKLWETLYDNGIREIRTSYNKTYDVLYTTEYTTTQYCDINESIWFIIGWFDSDYWYYFRKDSEYDNYDDWNKYEKLELHNFLRKDKLERIISDDSEK